MTFLRTIICTMLLMPAILSAAQSIVQPFSRLSLLFAGDLMQHQSQLNAARCSDGTYSFSACYDYIRPEVSAADVAIANLETTIGSKGFGGYPAFCAPDSFLYAAKGAGFDVLLFANNHCLDRGRAGALRTLAMMDSLGIAHCGVYRDSLDRAQRVPLIIERKGIRLALLNYTYGTNGIPVPPPLIVNFIDKELIAADIKRAREKRAYAIIACLHWGDEYVSLPPKRVRELTDWLIEQGVDHIIGGHPHVLQPMEVRRDSISGRRSAVVYSLGNLISGMYARGRDGGALVRVELFRFGGLVYMGSLSYSLTWVARPGRDGVRNFTILPAARPPLELGGATRSKMGEFLRDSRELFLKHNRGVGEYLMRE